MLVVTEIVMILAVVSAATWLFHLVRRTVDAHDAATPGVHPADCLAECAERWHPSAVRRRTDGTIGRCMNRGTANNEGQAGSGE